MTSQQSQTDILLDGLMFPEAPRWRENRLWFTDQHARKVVCVDSTGRAETLVETPDLPGGLGWMPDGTPLLVLMTWRKLFRITTQGLSEFADLGSYASCHCNDMVVDKQGRAFVGNFGFDLHGGESLKAAEVLMVDINGAVCVAADDLIFPNGSAITPDGKTLIVAETFAARLTAFDIQANGQLTNRRLWADLGGAYPDGICLDAEGGLWVAAPNKGEVLRVKQGGEVTARIRPRGSPYACMLGGEKRRSLYIATAETDDPAKARELKSGRIEQLAVEIEGAGLP